LPNHIQIKVKVSQQQLSGPVGMEAGFIKNSVQGRKSHLQITDIVSDDFAVLHLDFSRIVACH
jgi:hypothetical protein